MLEASLWPVNSFWTLTYDDAHMPHTEDGLETLSLSDLTNFIKRLRKEYQPQKLRYFYVGEYGDTTWRPHYHLALFNYPACSRGVTQITRRGDCCSVCSSVKRIWSAGLVHSGQLEDSSAAYIAGYVTKKLTQKGDPKLKGRKEEFANMSRRPGIGAGFIPEVASAILTHNLDGTLSDVPTGLRHGNYVRPLGRYCTRLLREHIGRAPNAPTETIEAQQEKLRPLREAARAVTPKGVSYHETFKNMIIDANEGRHKQLDARSKLFKKRGSI